LYPTQLERPRFIVNFPTKEHWNSDSVIANVEIGLQHLRFVIYSCDVESIAIPALGCGLGGLDWEDVRPLMLDALSGIDECQVLVYEPR
jgi:O-acetyl-ADP-ribose deacetylase (regulator of RNase III)